MKKEVGQRKSKQVGLAGEQAPMLPHSKRYLQCFAPGEFSGGATSRNASVFPMRSCSCSDVVPHHGSAVLRRATSGSSPPGLKATRQLFTHLGRTPRAAAYPRRRHSADSCRDGDGRTAVTPSNQFEILRATDLSHQDGCRWRRVPWPDRLPAAWSKQNRQRLARTSRPCIAAEVYLIGSILARLAI